MSTVGTIGTLVSPQQSFEEKLMGRIRDSIGELMSDEDLKRIVEKGIDRALFERQSSGDSWNKKVEPSLVDKAVQQFLAERMRAAVDAWILANPEKLDKAVNDAIVLGAGGCLLEAFNEKFRNAMFGMQEQMKQQLLR
jgi:hypothetical protein